MQKTRFGLSVGLMGAAIYLMGFYGGYLVTVLLAGYVLLFEGNEWLRRSAVKAVVLMVCFSIASTLIYLIPNVINVLDGFVGIFGGSIYINAISSFASAVGSALDIIEKVLFIGLGLKALTQGNIAVPVVDKLINKYMR